MGLPLDQTTLESVVLLFMFSLENQPKLKRSLASPLLLPLSIYLLNYHLYVSSPTLNIHHPKMINKMNDTLAMFEQIIIILRMAQFF